MRILTRYILLEIAKVFAITLLAMTSMMLIVGVIREATSQGLGPAQIAQLIPFILPDALRFTVPGTILFAACSVYGRMSADNEIVATKSLGIQPMSLIWPTYIVAFLLSVATVWLNDLAVSWGRNGAREVVLRSVDEIAYGMLRTQKSYSTAGFSINVKRVEGRRMIQPTLSFHSKNDASRITIRAEEAELRVDHENDLLIIACRDGAVDFNGQGSYHFSGVEERALPISEATQAKGDSNIPGWMALRTLSRETIQQERMIVEQQQKMAAKAALQMLTGDVSGLCDTEWQSEAGSLAALRDKYYRMLLEPQRRIANGFSCLCFVMVGVPMAIRRRTANVWSNFFACFLPILLAYYPLLVVAVDMGKTGKAPPYFVWGGNLLLALWGLWMMRNVNRY